MSQQQKDDQHEASQMENLSHQKPLALGSDPAVLALLLVFFLLFSAFLPSAWPLIVGAAALGLGIRWGIFWYDKYHRRKP